MPTMVEFAESYANKFHAVVPVGAWEFKGRDGEIVSMWKKPLIPDWTTKPLTTVAQVCREWERYSKYGNVPNIGIATGQICGGYIVIDLDRHPDRGIDGYEVLTDWERDTGRMLPESWTAITGSGGYHIWFHTQIAMRSYANAEMGVDLRADGAQIVVPPSLHRSGKRYEWEISPKECPCAEANEDVMAFIEYCRPNGSEYRQSTHRGQGGERRMLLPPEIVEGGRHAPLISLIGTLNRLGASDATIEQAVRTENEQKCKPPFSETELQKEIFPAIYRWEKGISAEEWKDTESWRKQQAVSYQAEQRRKRALRS